LDWQRGAAQSHLTQLIKEAMVSPHHAYTSTCLHILILMGRTSAGVSRKYIQTLGGLTLPPYSSWEDLLMESARVDREREEESSRLDRESREAIAKRVDESSRLAINIAECGEASSRLDLWSQETNS
jgi:hypothetical protein